MIATRTGSGVSHGDEGGSRLFWELIDSESRGRHSLATRIHE